MQKTTVRGLTAALALTLGTAYALDLGGLIEAGKGAVKVATLSDADVKASADEACAYFDKKNKVAAANSPYAKRLAKLTAGLENEDGIALNFKAYLVPEINAFAMANGCVRVYSGLMDKATDDEIRGVIGHEIGHAKLGHTLAKMRVELMTATARQGAAASGGAVAGLASSEVGGYAEAFVNAQFSQKEESDADVYGFQFMKRHNYDPNAMVSLFKKLPGSGGLMSSHPASADRASKIEALIQKGQ
nr:M48 family metallopeptidase [uncultured Albidiferax sp.]